MFGNDFFSMRRLDPWREVMRLQDDMNNVFAGLRSSTQEYPAMNLWSGEDGLILQAEMPGVEAKDLEISLLADILTVKATRGEPQLKEGEVYHRREIEGGDFARTVQLPFRVDAERVEAQLSNGLLRVTLPRAADDKPKKISIHS